MPKVNNIQSRNLKAGKEAETLLWRAMCDNMDDAKEYVAADCVMMNPLVSTETLHKDGTTVHKAMDDIDELGGYRVDGGMEVIEIDMMAVQVMYRGTFTTSEGKEVKAA